MIYKSIAVVVLLILGNVAVAHIRDGYEMGSVVPPSTSLADTALQIGSWSGADLPADPRLREILRAKAGIDRVYRDDEGQQVLVHAVWTDDYLRIHFPQQCYREAGWELTETEDCEIERSDGSLFDAKILSFSRDGRRIKVLYWFQLGEHVFLDRIQHRLLRRKVCWGQKEWPPLMKFMIETPDTGLGRGRQTLKDFSVLFEREMSNST